MVDSELCSIGTAATHLAKPGFLVAKEAQNADERLQYQITTKPVRNRPFQRR